MRPPPIPHSRLAQKKKLKDTLNTLGKVRDHVCGDAYRDVLPACRQDRNLGAGFGSIPVWLRKRLSLVAL